MSQDQPKDNDPETVNPRTPPSRGHGDCLNRLQERAIEALLTTPSVLAAAQRLEVHPNTLRRWLRLPQFRAAYQQTSQQLLSNTINLMQSSTHAAIAALRQELLNENVTTRMQAAGMILSYTVKSTELLNLTERVSQLEAALKGRK